MVHRFSMFRAVMVVLIIAIPTAVFAQVGNPSGGNDSVTWDITASGHDKVILRVSCAEDLEYQKTFANGNAVRFFLRDLPGNDVPNGHCAWQLWTTPKVPAGIAKKLADAREAGDSAGAKKILKDAGVSAGQYQSGSFLVQDGSIFPLGLTEGGSSARSVGSDSVDPNGPGASSSTSRKSPAGGPTRNLDPTTLDQVIPDDLIVQSSLCVGFDCVDGESFGVDTIRMKENNTRINFLDTSTSAGFASNDWRIIANEQPSGGANMLAFEDSTAARNLMTIEAGAPANSLYVDSTGNIGFQQSAPALDLHVTSTDTPAMRYEQSNAGGFTAQTWDIGANEANFFVRDVTGGSRLSFRIRPGAPTSSIDIASDGDVGIGTGSPEVKLHVFGGLTDDVIAGFGPGPDGLVATEGAMNIGYAGASFGRGAGFFNARPDSGATAPNPSLRFMTANLVRMLIDNEGFIALGSLAQTGGNPTSPIHYTNGANTALLTTAGVWQDASSREAKENISDLSTGAALETLRNLTPVTYNYKVVPDDPKVGFIAEDVPDMVATPERKGLSALDIVAVVTKVVQDQQKTIEELNARIAELEKAKPQQ